MRRLLLSACTLLLVLSLMDANARADSYTGTWCITPSSTPGQVSLEMRYHHADASGNEEWSESHDIPAPAIRNNTFTVTTDPGSFVAQATFNGPNGGGTWTFQPSSTFASELQRRGVAAPTQAEQFHLAMAEFKLSTRMRSHGYTHLSADDLIRLRDHGF